MAAERETPTENGIPFPLVPIGNLLSARKGDVNWHHHFHPRTDPLLVEDEGVVIRASRLQYAFAHGNHEQYHQYFTGPELPQTQEERFKVAVLARAGYIPEHGILMRGRLSPKIVTLSPSQRHLLTTEGHIRPGSTGLTREFLGRYVLEQDFSNLKEIDEFLHTTIPGRRRFLGNWILAQGIEQAIQPVENEYREAWSAGKIPQFLPFKPHTFLSNSLGRPGQRAHLIDQMQQQLAA